MFSQTSMRAIIVLVAATGGCAPGFAGDYRDNYGNNAYYGNIYGNNSGNGDNGYTASNNDDRAGGSSQHHHRKHPISGNECSDDSAGNQNCGGNP